MDKLAQEDHSIHGEECPRQSEFHYDYIRSHTVSKTHRVELDWLFDRINLDPNIQIKYIDTKNQFADILTKGSFTRDEWNHLLCLFDISHFSSTVCAAAMAKRSQQDSGEERVTAKSKPLMNPIARTPSFVPSSTSVSPVKRYYGKQDPWKSVVAEDRSGQPDRETESFSSTKPEIISVHAWMRTEELPALIVL